MKMLILSVDGLKLILEMYKYYIKKVPNASHMLLIRATINKDYKNN